MTGGGLLSSTCGLPRQPRGLPRNDGSKNQLHNTPLQGIENAAAIHKSKINKLPSVIARSTSDVAIHFQKGWGKPTGSFYNLKQPSAYIYNNHQT